MCKISLRTYILLLLNNKETIYYIGRVFKRGYDPFLLNYW